DVIAAASCAPSDFRAARAIRAALANHAHSIESDELTDGTTPAPPPVTGVRVTAWMCGLDSTSARRRPWAFVREMQRCSGASAYRWRGEVRRPRAGASNPNPCRRRDPRVAPPFG